MRRINIVRNLKQSSGVGRRTVPLFVRNFNTRTQVVFQESSPKPIVAEKTQQSSRGQSWRKNAWIALLSALLVASLSLSDEDKQELMRLFTNSDKLEDEISQLIVEKCITDGIIGGTFCCSVKDQIVYHKSFGYNDLENSIPMKTSDKLRIASISKSLTAVALGLLVQEGIVDWDTPAYEYLKNDPRFANMNQSVTLRQLAGHLSGIRHYKNKDEFRSNKKYANNIDPVEVFINDELAHEPGTKYLYTSFGYTLLGAVIETKLSERNTNMLTFMKRHIFDELDMKSTVPDKPEQIIKHRARCYTRRNNQLYNSPAVDQSNKLAGAGYLSTAEDLVKFGNGVLFNKLLPKAIQDELLKEQEILETHTSSEQLVAAKQESVPESHLLNDTEEKTVQVLENTSNEPPSQSIAEQVQQVDKAHTPDEQTQQVTSPVISFNSKTTGYGMGFLVDKMTVSGRKVSLVGHTGGAVGGSSILLIVPEEQIVVSMIVNTEDIKLRPLAEQIIKRTLVAIEKDKIFL